MRRVLAFAAAVVLLAGCVSAGASVGPTTTESHHPYDLAQRIKALERKAHRAIRERVEAAAALAAADGRVADAERKLRAVTRRVGDTERRLRASGEALEAQRMVNALPLTGSGLSLAAGSSGVLLYRVEAWLGEPLSVTLPEIEGVTFAPSGWTWPHGHGSQYVTVTVAADARPAAADGLAWGLFVEPTVTLGDRPAVAGWGRWVTVLPGHSDGADAGE